MSDQLVLPDLESRFLPTENWKNGQFINSRTQHKIHYNFSLSLLTNPKGTVVALPGLSEFGEKYLETAKFFNTQGYNFYVIDWTYQGRSTRYQENTQKRHSDGYDSDISDIDYLIKNIIKQTQPLYMLAHSMGGNIGLRYLIKYPDIFKAASFSAPMIGIKDLQYTDWLITPILGLLKNIQTLYIPGGKDWHETARKSNGTDIFSSDPIRDQVHNKWCFANPILQVGNPTFKWIYESLKSISIIKKNITKTKIPALIATAEKEVLVSNKDIKKYTKNISNIKLLELKNSKHEILMETDDIRDKFLSETLKLFSQ